MYAGVVDNQIKKRFIAESASIFFKSVNIWQSYEQDGGCLVHFMCLATTLLQTKKMHDTIHLCARNYAKYSRILKMFLFSAISLS